MYRGKAFEILFCPTCGESDYGSSDIEENAFVCNNCKTIIKNKNEFIGFMEAIRVRARWKEIIKIKK